MIWRIYFKIIPSCTYCVRDNEIVWSTACHVINNFLIVVVLNADFWGNFELVPLVINHSLTILVFSMGWAKHLRFNNRHEHEPLLFFSKQALVPIISFSKVEYLRIKAGCENSSLPFFSFNTFYLKGYPFELWLYLSKYFSFISADRDTCSICIEMSSDHFGWIHLQNEPDIWGIWETFLYLISGESCLLFSSNGFLLLGSSCLQTLKLPSFLWKSQVTGILESSNLVNCLNRSDTFYPLPFCLLFGSVLFLLLPLSSSFYTSFK